MFFLSLKEKSYIVRSSLFLFRARLHFTVLTTRNETWRFWKRISKI